MGRQAGYQPCGERVRNDGILGLPWPARSGSSWAESLRAESGELAWVRWWSSWRWWTAAEGESGSEAGGDSRARFPDERKWWRVRKGERSGRDGGGARAWAAGEGVLDPDDLSSTATGASAGAPPPSFLLLRKRDSRSMGATVSGRAERQQRRLVAVAAAAERWGSERGEEPGGRLQRGRGRARGSAARIRTVGERRRARVGDE